MISPVHTWTAERTGLGSSLSCETLSGWHQDILGRAVEYACKNSRYYHKNIKQFDSLKDLPFTLPSDIVNDPGAFLAIPQSSVARVSTLANSGTTSLRKRVFFSEADLKRTKDFFSAGMTGITGAGEHVRILISNMTENSLGSLLSASLNMIGVTAKISGIIKTVERAVEDSYSSDCLAGMPAEIMYMCRTAPSLRPKSVLLAGDIAPQSVIKAIEETWGCNVFTHYGHTEFGYGCAVDCEQHDGLHLRDADLIFEIIDPVTGNNRGPGENGEIVITTLSNEAMPLIRYRTGNISHFIDTPCKCGSGLRRLGRVKERCNNLVTTDHGKTLNIYKADEIMFANPALRGYNALFERSCNTLHLTIDATDHIDITPLMAVLPEDLAIDIEYGRADPFANRGKRRIMIKE